MLLEDHIKKMRLVIVSNRLPLTFEKVDGQIKMHPTSGGLVTALFPILKDRGGIWIGSLEENGMKKHDLMPLYKEAGDEYGFEFAPVALSKEEMDLYYHGFSNEIIWPLFHDLVSRCVFNPKYWEAYKAVNMKFAETIVSVADANDFIWVHDYHLLLAARKLRKKEFAGKVGFFLHIPFPPPDMFIKLPWRHEIINALLDFDLVGFQTHRDQRNFIMCVKMLTTETAVQTQRNMQICKREQRNTAIGTFPISIDFNAFDQKARSDEITDAAWCLHEKWPDQKMIFSLDRLDYSKGIPYRLEAIRSFLQKHPEFYKQVCFVQVVIPSRVDIAEYYELKREIDRLVGEINGQFTQENWVPINYIYRSLTSSELSAFYRTSEVCLITSLKDGMNLVCKEYVASQIDHLGILILSEFAGAAIQMREGALLVNPFDIDGIANTIYKALTLSDTENKHRIRYLRRQVKRYDIFWWVKMYLTAAISKELKDFPQTLEEIASFNIPNNELDIF